MIRLLAVLFLVMTSTMVHAQSGPPWTGSNFGFNYIFRAIDFPSGQSSIGFACGESLTYQGNGIVIKTTDGGVTWTQVWAGSGRGIEGASFVDINTGYIAGWPQLGQGWSGFAKTTDGGSTWTSYPVTNDIYFFTDVVFKDEDHGIIIGQTNMGAGVWVTSNGGTTWLPGSGLVAIPQHACHVSGNTWFLVDNDGHIQKSTNNGLTWSTVWTAPGSVYILGIDHFGDEIIMACGDNGGIVVSNDAGATWNALTVGFDIWHDFGWESEDHVFVCGTPGLVYESWDGGATWENAGPQGAGQSALYECILTEDYKGFICGSQGVEMNRVPVCGAGFSADLTQICSGTAVGFTNESWGNINTYSWWFEGGTPELSSDQDPVVTYNTPGTFDVKLTVSNPWWGDSLTRTHYITVTAMPETPVITVDGLTLSSNTPAGNQWYLNGDPIPGATGQTWEAVVTGMYYDRITSGPCVSDTSNQLYLVMTGIPGQHAGGFTISPVPNHGRFTVSMPGITSGEFDIMVFNHLGSVIFRKHYPDSKSASGVTIDLGRVPEGIYLVVVSDGLNKYHRSVMID